MVPGVAEAAVDAGTARQAVLPVDQDRGGASEAPVDRVVHHVPQRHRFGVLGAGVQAPRVLRGDGLPLRRRAVAVERAGGDRARDERAVRIEALHPDAARQGDGTTLVAGTVRLARPGIGGAREPRAVAVLERQHRRGADALVRRGVLQVVLDANRIAVGRRDYPPRESEEPASLGVELSAFVVVRLRLDSIRAGARGARHDAPRTHVVTHRVHDGAARAVHRGIGERRVAELRAGAEPVRDRRQQVGRHRLVQVHLHAGRNVGEVCVTVAIGVERHRRRRQGARRDAGELAGFEGAAGRAAIAEFARAAPLQQVGPPVGVPVRHHGASAGPRRRGSGRVGSRERGQCRLACTGAEQQLPGAACLPVTDVGETVAVEVAEQRLGIAVVRVLCSQDAAVRGKHDPAVGPARAARGTGAVRLLRQHEQVHAPVAVEVAAARDRAEALRRFDERGGRQARVRRHRPQHGLRRERESGARQVASPVDRIAGSLHVHEVVAAIAVDVGGDHAAGWRRIDQAQRGVGVVAGRGGVQAMQVRPAARHDHFAATVAVEVDSDSLASVAVLAEPGRQGCVREAARAAAHDHPLARGRILVGKVIETVAVHVAGRRRGERGRGQPRGERAAPPRGRGRPAELRGRQARGARALLERREPAAAAGGRRLVAEIEAAHDSRARDVHHVDAVQARGFADRAAGDVAGRLVHRWPCLIDEPRRVVRRGSGVQVAGVVDARGAMRAGCRVFQVHDVRVIAIAVADAAERPVARREAARGLDPRRRGGAVFVDQPVALLDAEIRGPGAGSAVRRDAREALDLRLVDGSRDAIGPRHEP